jgi:hypothetical protein
VVAALQAPEQRAQETRSRNALHQRPLGPLVEVVVMVMAAQATGPAISGTGWIRRGIASTTTTVPAAKISRPLIQ